MTTSLEALVVKLASYDAGAYDEQNSYRGELGGILASYTNDVCKRHDITTGKCIMGCDNTGALSAIFG